MTTNNLNSKFINTAFISYAISEYHKSGCLLNKVLYDLCEEHFDHTSPNAIVAKTQLIGRTYAVALERRKNKKEINDNFYADSVVKTFKESVLDYQLATLKKNQDLTYKALHEALKTHKYLTDLLFELTELEKRSFSSKYLHFHLPHLFFIYDSRAVSSLRAIQEKLPKERKELWDIINDSSVDKEYSKFACKCFYLTEKIRQELEIRLTTRELDVIFLKKANNMLAEELV